LSARKNELIIHVTATAGAWIGKEDSKNLYFAAKLPSVAYFTFRTRLL
jgi:hypothetical protein